MMSAFNKLRYRKTSLALFILAFLTWLVLAVRAMAGANLSIPDIQTAVLPIFIIGVAFNLIAVILWLPLHKKGVKFIDLLYPVGTAGAIAIFIYFHVILFS